VTRFLNNDYGELEKAATMLGFESNAFCYHPAQHKWYFNDKAKTEDGKGVREPFSVNKRSWFTGQKKNSTRPYFSDIYKFAGTEKLGLTFCVPIQAKTKS
jgi:hypothetical protein